MKNRLAKIKWGLIGMVIVVVAAAITLAFVFTQPDQSAISLSVENLTLQVGESKQLNITCSDSNAQYSFEVYDEEIARVEDGKVFGMRIGDTSIRITAVSDGKRAVSVAKIFVVESSSLPIVNLPSQIQLYLIDKNLQEAELAGLKNQIEISANKEYNVSISGDAVKIKNNTICANKQGEATITFVSKTGGDAQQVLVKVKSIPATISNLPSQINLAVDEQASIDFAIVPSYYSGDADVTFKSQSQIIKIDGNTLSAISAGSGVIDVYLNDEKVDEIEVLIESQFDCVVDVISGGVFKDDTIFLSPNQSACVSIQIYSSTGQPVNFSGAQILTDGVQIKRDMNYFHISSQNGGKIIINLPDLGGIVTIFVAII